MDFRLWALTLGGVTFAYALMQRDKLPDPDGSDHTPAGLTVTQTEALGWVGLNKLAYPALNVVPDSVALAVIEVESNFDPNAKAPAGEIGLMQIIVPGTWADVIHRANLGRYGLDPYKAKDNILVGLHYLRLIRAELSTAGYLGGNDSENWANIDQAYNLGPAGYRLGRTNQTRRARFLAARAKYQRAGLL